MVRDCTERVQARNKKQIQASMDQSMKYKTIRKKIQEYLDTEQISVERFANIVGLRNVLVVEFLKEKPLDLNIDPVYLLCSQFFRNSHMPVRKPKYNYSRLSDKSKKFIQQLETVPELSLHSNPVFDDCDTIRKKIKDLLSCKLLTKTQFTEHVGINNSSLNRYLSVDGPTNGMGSSSYFKSYLFFERVRIAFNLEKSPERLQNEKKLPNGFKIELNRGRKKSDFANDSH